MFKLDPPRTPEDASSPPDALKTRADEVETTKREAAATPAVPIAIGIPHSRRPDSSEPGISPDPQQPLPLNDPFFRGWLGGLMRRWLVSFEGERGSRFWGAAAGVLLCVVCLRALWAFGSEQPVTHWERDNRPHAIATDGSRLAAFDVVVQRRLSRASGEPLLVISGVVENQGGEPVPGAQVAVSFDDNATPVMSWAGHWLSPGELEDGLVAATLEALGKRPENAIVPPGKRLPFVLVVRNVPANTPIQLHVAAGPERAQASE